MKVRFNFDLDAWIDSVEVEADSEQAALEKLQQMSISEMLEAGGYEKGSRITEVDSEVVEATYNVHVTSIDYDINWTDVPDPEGNLSEEEIEEEIKKIKASLPKTMDLEVDGESDDLDDIIVDEVSERTGYLVNFVTYDIISKK